MLDRFQLKLTLLSSAIIGAVLLVLTVLCLDLSERSARSQEAAGFSSAVGTLSQNLFSQPYISHTSLTQAACASDLLLALYDRGMPLLYQTPKAQERDIAPVLEAVREKALATYQIDITAAATGRRTVLRQDFSLRLAGSDYLCCAVVIPKDGKVLGVAMAHSLAGLSRRIARLRLVFAAGDVLALLLLAFLFSLFIRRMLRPIRENEQRQAAFVASASHELRAPLAVLDSRIDAAKAGNLPVDDNFWNTLLAQTGRLARLTGDLLTLSRGDAQSWQLTPGPTALDTLLLDLYEAYEIPARAKQITLHISLPEHPLPACVCDRDRICQLLVILLDNALSYTPAGGRVCLCLEGEGGFTLQVIDNGPGIPDAQKEAVFRRFYRGDEARTGSDHFGLGLSIAAGIVRAHRGRIRITDTPGGGATLTVSLS